MTVYKWILEDMYNVVTKIFVALLWTLCSLSTSLLCGGDQNWSQHSRCGMTSTKLRNLWDTASCVGWEYGVGAVYLFLFWLCFHPCGCLSFLTCLFFAFCKFFFFSFVLFILNQHSIFTFLLIYMPWKWIISKKLTWENTVMYSVYVYV